MVYAIVATIAQVVMVLATLIACVGAGEPNDDDSDHEYDKVPDDFEEE